MKIEKRTIYRMVREPLYETEPLYEPFAQQSDLMVREPFEETEPLYEPFDRNNN